MKRFGKQTQLTNLANSVVNTFTANNYQFKKSQETQMIIYLNKDRVWKQIAAENHQDTYNSFPIYLGCCLLWDLSQRKNAFEWYTTSYTFLKYLW